MTNPDIEYLKWYYRYSWTRVLMALYCASCIFIGIIGFSGQPAVSIELQLGYYAVLLYSGILVICGIIGVIGIFRNIRAVVIAVYGIAAASFFHGASAWSQGNLQTGLRLMIAPLMMVPVIWAWSQWLVIVKHTDHLTLFEEKDE